MVPTGGDRVLLPLRECPRTGGHRKRLSKQVFPSQLDSGLGTAHEKHIGERRPCAALWVPSGIRWDSRIRDTGKSMAYTGKKLSIVTDYLIQYIRSNAMEQGDRLPTENEMLLHTGVSRVTLRRALANMQEQNCCTVFKDRGILWARQGIFCKLTESPC